MENIKKRLRDIKVGSCNPLASKLMELGQFLPVANIDGNY